jgi:DNA primase
MTTQTYNPQSDLLDLIGHDVQLRKAATTNGGEWKGACPFCGGRDRFSVWPNASRPGWWCRMCEKHGDAIQYLREQGMSYGDACRVVGKELDAPRRASSFIAPPAECEPPSQQWREAGAGFVFWAQERISQALPYLTGRGLTEQTIQRAGLGYNPQTREASRAKWGLAPDGENGDRFWLPAGIVIPWYVGSALWKVSIRRETVKEGQDRYKTLPGSSNALYGVDSLQPGRPAVLVEGPFDALATRQAAGDLVGVAASGTSGARRIKWVGALALCSEVLVSLDADQAGDTASIYWLDMLSNARRHRPYYSDPAQMLEDGQDLRAWVRVGLGGPEPMTFTSQIVADYWRGEVAAQSSALTRLAAICQARGYSYELTIEALGSE